MGDLDRGSAGDWEECPNLAFVRAPVAPPPAPLIEPSNRVLVVVLDIAESTPSLRRVTVAN